jgi:hypothetical protein
MKASAGGVKTIVVSGAHSGIGKTRLAEEILGYLPDWSALKVTVKQESGCPRDNSCQVCEEIRDEFEIITDSKIIRQKGTDTARLKKAGARRVIWLRANLGGLQRGLNEAFSLLKKAQGIVIEGNSVLKFVKPDIVIFISQLPTGVT